MINHRNLLSLSIAIILGLLGYIAYITTNSNTKLGDPLVVNVNTITNILSMKSKLITPSEDTKRHLKEFSNISDAIVAVQLVNVTPQLNARTTAFVTSKSAELETALASLGEPTPIFIEGNEFNNKRMISIMNGEFWCYASANTLVVQIVPQVQPIAPVMCTIAVPPNGREFSGYLNVFVSRSPISTEIEDWRYRLTSLAASIYATDSK